MNKKIIARVLPHFIAVLIFLIVATIYCRPVLTGQVLQQSDVTQWRSMAHNSFEYKEKYGHYPLWTNNLFSGMPTYQIAMDPDVIVTPFGFYHLFTLYLPKPINFFFLACICFYFLTQVLRINPYIGLIGGLAYAYVTYNPIIVAVGHDTKMQSIALLPAFIASLILIYEKKYWWGALLMVIFTNLLTAFNHVQIIYYILIIAAFMTAGFLVRWIKQKDFKHLTIALSVAVLSGLLGLLCNAVTFFTTYDSSKTTIRGGTELPSKNTTKEGLNKQYAFDYSMYPSEPLVMLVPKMYGGSDGMEVDEDKSKAVAALRGMPQGYAQQLQYYLQSYWGGIGGTSGPPYAGAIICLLAIVGFVVLPGEHKWWILAAGTLAILMSWGGYFDSFNGFLLKTLPMYNKFRAPSMIIVIPTFLLCLMAVLTLQQIVTSKDKLPVWESYKKGLLLTACVFAVVLLLYFNLDFTSPGDRYLLKQSTAMPGQAGEYARQFVAALKEDRQGLYFSSLLRSLLFAAAGALLVVFYLKNKLKTGLLLAGIGLLAFTDVITIDVKYLNTSNYQDEADYQQNNFTPSAADQQIMADKGSYRVFDAREGVQNAFNISALSAYYHRSIGGYHPAKLSIYQDLIEHQLYNYPNCPGVINMLNTKYIIEPDSTGHDMVVTNKAAAGDAWFVKTIQFEPTPEAVMNALNTFNPTETAVLFSKDKEAVQLPAAANPADAVYLVENKNDELTYQSKATTPRFAVFSEIYYNRGWKAYIDNKEMPIIRTNYALRGLVVPAGAHTIRFAFHPTSFYLGLKVANIAGVLFVILLLTVIFLTYKRSKHPIQ